MSLYITKNLKTTRQQKNAGRDRFETNSFIEEKKPARMGTLGIGRRREGVSSGFRSVGGPGSRGYYCDGFFIPEQQKLPQKI